MSSKTNESVEQGFTCGGKLCEKPPKSSVTVGKNVVIPKDIIAAKRSDTILGKERLSDPESGEVFEFDQGFYQKEYRLHPHKFNRNNLRPLGDDEWKLWNKPPLDGKKHVRYR